MTRTAPEPGRHYHRRYFTPDPMPAVVVRQWRGCDVCRIHPANCPGDSLPVALQAGSAEGGAGQLTALAPTAPKTDPGPGGVC
jgi:hypothetical protein